MIKQELTYRDGEDEVVWNKNLSTIIDFPLHPDNEENLTLLITDYQDLKKYTFKSILILESLACLNTFTVIF